MEHTNPDQKNKRSTGEHVIAFGALILAFCALAALFLLLVFPRLQSAPVVEKSELPQAAEAQITLAPTTPSPAPAQSSATALPLVTAQPTLTATVKPSASHRDDDEDEHESGESDDEDEHEHESRNRATGDFSATFPAEDTGVGALLSYQSDTLRIAINQVEESGTTYFVADVWVKNIQSFQTALAKDSYGRGLRELPLDMAKHNDAIFAVSGDYYGARETGVVVRNGVLYRDVMSDDVCILKNDGTLKIYSKDAFSAFHDLDETVWQAWAFGPALVENGKVSDTSGSNISVKNPRCAIGYYAPGHYCIIVVDGRQSGYSDGMTLDELAKTFAALGCETAYNLDGGTSAMMIFQGKLVSHPVDGGRSSSDIVYFK